jgi:hypothetical protein
MTPNNQENEFRMLVNSQNKIGWQHLLKGCFSKQWTKIQGRHILEDPELDQEKQLGGQWLKLVLHHLWTLVWQVWLTKTEDDLHGCNSHEKERKRLQKLHPRITALHAKQGLLLASNKQIFEFPIHDHMPLHSRELKTCWVRLVAPTVKRALADAEQHLRDTDHTIPDFLAPARPGPLTTDELVNECVQRLGCNNTSRSNATNKFFFSSCFAFGSRQLCACRSCGSISGAGPPRGGGDEAVKTSSFAASLRLVPVCLSVFSVCPTAHIKGPNLITHYNEWVRRGKE